MVDAVVAATVVGQIVQGSVQVDVPEVARVVVNTVVKAIVIQHALEAVKMDAIHLVMVDARVDVMCYAEATAREVAQMIVQMPVEAAKVAAHITVQTVVAIAGVVV